MTTGGFSEPPLVLGGASVLGNLHGGWRLVHRSSNRGRFSEFSVYHVTCMFPLLACQLGNKQFDMYRIGNLYIFDSAI